MLYMQCRKWDYLKWQYGREAGPTGLPKTRLVQPQALAKTLEVKELPVTLQLNITGPPTKQ